MIQLLFFLTSFNFAHAKFNEVDLKWKARGIQAKERLEQLSAKKKKTEYELCVEYFETGFAEHADPKVSTELKKDVDGHRIYSLRIITPIDQNPSATKDEKDMSLLVVDYDKSGEITGTSLFKVAKGWSVLFLKNIEGFVLAKSNCQFFIYPEDPLQSKAREKK